MKRNVFPIDRWMHPGIVFEFQHDALGVHWLIDSEKGMVIRDERVLNSEAWHNAENKAAEMDRVLQKPHSYSAVFPKLVEDGEEFVWFSNGVSIQMKYYQLVITRWPHCRWFGGGARDHMLAMGEYSEILAVVLPIRLDPPAELNRLTGEATR